MNASIGDGMAALGLAGGIFDYLYLKYRIRQRQIDILHHERMAAMEKGITLPELKLEEPRPDHRTQPFRLRSGLDQTGSFLITDEREHRSLRVLAIDDPAPSGHLHWAVHDLPAAGFNTFDGCLDRVHVEVEVPA